MVRPERFELPTCCSGGNRSIQLSYGRTPLIIHSRLSHKRAFQAVCVARDHYHE